jgi:hypothetical protein
LVSLPCIVVLAVALGFVAAFCEAVKAPKRPAGCGRSIRERLTDDLPKRKTNHQNNYKMSRRPHSIGLSGETIMQIPTASTKVSRSLSGILAAIAVLAAGEASGQAPAPVEYAVKFVCGRAVQDRTTSVATGFYYTDINVHNPNTAGIEFKKKFAVALPNQKPGKVSEFFSAALKPDEAFSVDCFEILKRLGLSPSSFVTGFAVFQTTRERELDVVAVYTAAASPSSPVVTMHMERVPKRP